LPTYYFFGKKEKEPSEMSNSEKIEAARRKKEEGNLLFKTGKYQQAGKKYYKVTRYVPVCTSKLSVHLIILCLSCYVVFSQAADYISEDESFGNDEEKLAKQLRVSCWLNRAACSLKLNDFQGAIKLCSQVDSKRRNIGQRWKK
jgi:FK506-binding protein 4/5